MNLPLDGPLDRIGLQVIDLWPQWDGWLAALRALSGIMYGLPTIKEGIVVLTFFAHRAGHNILDLGSGVGSVLQEICQSSFLLWPYHKGNNGPNG